MDRHLVRHAAGPREVKQGLGDNRGFPRAMAITGRLILDSAAEGAWNMAVDEWLLRSAMDRPTLRFYAWREATVSLGYFQRWQDRQAHAASRSCPSVRRHSGGGAIVHDNELTYSFVVPVSGRWARGAGEIYMRVHQALADGLATWGARCQLARAAAGDPFLCFQRRSEGDLLLEGHKVVGSAQRRHEGALLQHGSILLGRSPCAPELPGIAELTGQPVDWERAVAVCRAALGKALGLAWQPEPLHEEEKVAIAQIEAAKFAAPGWNHRR